MPPADDEARKVAEEASDLLCALARANTNAEGMALIRAFAKRVREPLEKRIADCEAEHPPEPWASELQAENARLKAELAAHRSNCDEGTLCCSCEVRWNSLRAQLSEAQAELESKVHAIRSLQARLTAQTEHLQKFVDGNGKRTLRAQLSEAQADRDRWEQDALQKLNDYKLAMIDKAEAQARLASAMAEVHRHTQRADREMYRADNAQQRVEALEKLILIEAPHDAGCDTVVHDAQCSCYKASALARPEAPTPEEVKP